ncbi:trimeric intracellular cation channel family protein [Azohydromonas lata]|uniref:Trimeric intracellular cation channel family protein n=1 Tax=Azohydromonas lata TaxID=45677 RepID=A0ABU5IKL0_9BURK|nr:trimeric intracellular cation channel family protein [Azohydromonas lata]MDZ5459429.1 trimeric intracellular cation channel family protein [Azohydromonas lata]
MGRLPDLWGALSTAQLAIEVVATLSFALSGMVEAARKRLDAVGVCVVAGLTAFGGGTLRDVLLDRRPFFWVQHAGWVWALLGLAMVAMLFMRSRHLQPTERAMLWPDALGLGLYAASGTQIALQAQMPPLIAVLMGVVSASFGGVLRDIVCNQIPSAFSDHRPYAALAFAGGWTVVGVQTLGGSDEAALAVGALVASSLRLITLGLDWRVPAWRIDDDQRH